MTPWWYGRYHPKLKDLVVFGESLGAGIHLDHLPAAVFVPDDPPIIMVPCQHGHLSTVWTLAHELGHLCHHSGRDGQLHWHAGEHKANQWAAGALLPSQRMPLIGFLRLDDLIDDLSNHFEYLHPQNHDARKLARKIARIRLRSIKEKIWERYECNHLMR